MLQNALDQLGDDDAFGESYVGAPPESPVTQLVPNLNC